MKYNKRMIDKQAHFAIKKLSIGAAAVLVSTSMYLGLRSSNVLADTNNDATNTSIAKNNNSKPTEEPSLNSDSKNDSSQNNNAATEVNNNSVSEEQPINNAKVMATSDLVKSSSTDSNSDQSHLLSKSNLEENKVIEATPQDTTEQTLTSAPVYTTQGQEPTLDIHALFTQDQLNQDQIDTEDDNTSLTWEQQPDVSKIGNTSGVAKLSYANYDADPTTNDQGEEVYPLKDIRVNVPVLVRKAEQEVGQDQVKNSLNIINTTDNSLVAHYEWVGAKAKNDDEEEPMPNSDSISEDITNMLQSLGFEMDDYSYVLGDITNFGTKDKAETLFVNPSSTDPVITGTPYFTYSGGDNISIDNVNETPAPASYIGNLGTLPAGTKIEWNEAPKYDTQKDADGNWVNDAPTNDPSIKVTLPGKDPIILKVSSDDIPLKDIATLPAYGNGTLLIKSDNQVKVGDKVGSPLDYVTNLDQYLKSDHAPEDVLAFKNSFKWTLAPNTQQAGYTLGAFTYGDDYGNMILFKVNPIPVNNSKTITRTITFEGLPQDLIPKVDPQTVTFTQNGQQTYVDEPIEWKTDDNTWKEYTAPTITGYTPTPDQSKIAQKTVKLDDQDVTVTIKYTANTEIQKYQFVDKTNGQNVGDPIIVEGKFGEQAPVSLTIPDNYKLAEGQTLPTETPVLSLSKDNAVIKIYLDHKTEDVTDTDADAKSTITETINVTTPDGKTTPVVKSVTFNRTATKDLVTGNVSYGAWSDNGTYTFPSYTAPEEPGYIPSQNEVPAQTVKPGDKDLVFDITYSAGEHTQVINYVDKNGKVIYTYNVPGKTGESVQTNVEKNVPKNWVIVGGQQIATSVTFGSDNPAPINVTIEHGTKDVTDDPTQADKVNKTITRTIDLDIAGKTSEYKKQIVTLHRTATEDLVTKEVTYGAWNVDGAKFDAVTAPEEAGYTVTNPKAASEVVVTGDTQDSTVTFTYTANAQTTTIKYVNTADHNDVVGTQPVNGKTGETVNVTYKAPENWKIVAGQPAGETITFGSTPVEDAIVYVEHGTKDVTNDPTQADKVKKTITRTIDLDIAGKTSEYKKQTVTLHRTATKDLVTGEVTYGAWNVDGAKFDAVTAPAEAGYTVTNPKAAPEVAVTGDTQDSTVTFTYTANDQGNTEHTQVINYVDKTGNVISHYNVTGKTGETVETNIEKNVPAGWVISSGQQIAPSVTFGSDNPAPISIIIVKKETATDTPITVDQPVKVVIIYKDKNGDTVGTTDKDYKNGDKVIFDIPEGYIPGEKVPDIIATPGTGVITVPVIKKGTDTPKTPMDNPSYNHPQEPSRDIMISTKKALPENKKIAADKPINVINTDSIQSNVKVIKATNKKKNNLISKKELPQTGNKSMVNSLLGLVVMTGSMILGFISKKKKN